MPEGRCCLGHRFGTIRPDVPLSPHIQGGAAMNGVIYLVGLVVVVLAILSFFGLR